MLSITPNYASIFAIMLKKANDVNDSKNEQSSIELWDGDSQVCFSADCTVALLML